MSSKIEWCDETWNVLAGCDHKSDGCHNCWAARMATRLSGLGGNYRGTVKGGRWTGKIKLIPDALEKPLHWKKPRRIFVQSMGDLFHEKVPFEFIDKVFAVMALCPQHTFMVLTKRTERMWEYAGTQKSTERVIASWASLTHGMDVDIILRPLDGNSDGFQLSNVHLYTSIEDQATADERIPWLLKTPAVVRGVSLEPMLGPVDLDGVTRLGIQGRRWLDMLDHVIVGAESGPGARPMKLNWVRDVRDQCVEAGVKFFLKQMVFGGKKIAMPMLDGRTWDEMPGQEEKHA